MPTIDEIFNDVKGPESAPKENWGKLPKYHMGRFYYKEVGTPAHLVLMYNTDPDLEGELSRPKPPPPPPPKVEFTEPMTITGEPPKRSMIPPPMQIYGQFPMPVQTAEPKKKYR